MIHAQINRDIRLSLADQILLIKAKKDLTFAQLTDGTGLSEAFVTAALLGQHALPADAARLVGEKLSLDEDAVLLLQMIHCAAVLTIAYPLTRPFIASMKSCRCMALR
jgi:cyanate lyase